MYADNIVNGKIGIISDAMERNLSLYVYTGGKRYHVCPVGLNKVSATVFSLEYMTFGDETGKMKLDLATCHLEKTVVHPSDVDAVNWLIDAENAYGEHIDLVVFETLKRGEIHDLFKLYAARDERLQRNSIHAVIVQWIVPVEVIGKAGLDLIVKDESGRVAYKSPVEIYMGTTPFVAVWDWEEWPHMPGGSTIQEWFVGED